MPTFSSVMKDTCPFVDFSSGWLSGTAADDELLDNYSQRTYTYSHNEGDTMTLQFNGTGVGIYGARRPDYGTYQVTVDGTTFPEMDASSDVALFNQTLFNATFDPGLHTVVIKNTGNLRIDVDYVNVQSYGGEPEEQLFSDTFQDDHPSFVYDPPEAWTEVARPGTFSGSSGHFSNQWNASFIHTFKGSTVFLYGTVTPTSSTAFTAQIDNGDVFTRSAQHNMTKPHQVMFYASGLGAGWHTLRVQVGAGPDVVGSLSIDFSNVYTTKSIGSGLYSPINGMPKDSSGHSASETKGLIAGLSITSTIAIVLLMALFATMSRHKRQQSKWRRLAAKTVF